MEDKISIIIPVHNGEKYIAKLVKKLLMQTYKNVEIILVENNSSDKSKEICQKLSSANEKVISIISDMKGTSLARKMGILNSRGKYIVFLDQDDCYVSNNALEKMYRAIENDKVQICQFCYYKSYFGVFKRLIGKNVENRIYEREEFLRNEIKGVIGIKGSQFNVNVWNKIYSGELLRKVSRTIDAELYFAEDVYLNITAFYNDMLTKVSVRKEAYYAWNFGVGFSSTSESGRKLFEEYEIIKPLAIECLRKYGCDEELVFACYWEVIWFHRYLVNEMIFAGIEKDKIEKCIAEMGEALFVQQAKNYFREQTIKELDEKVEFMISDYEPKEYLEWCLTNREKQSTKEKLIKAIRWIAKLKR